MNFEDSLPDVADLIVMEINFKDNGELSKGGFRQFSDFVALLLRNILD